MILLDPTARPIIAHRGNRAHAPENTLPALMEAVALGVDAVEFDLHVSLDGTLIVLHDPTLDRTTSGSGAVARLTLNALRGVDAGASFSTDGGQTYPWRGRGVTIPTFDEVVEVLPSDMPCIIELKTASATAPLLSALKRHGMQRRVIVAGFDTASTQPLRHEGLTLGASTADVTGLLLPSLLRRSIPRTHFRALCIPTLYRGIPLPIAAMVRAVRAAGIVTHVWTINDPAKARQLWEAGVQGIISDVPQLMLLERARAG